MKYYVPNKDYSCYQIIDRHTIRVYKQAPTYNQNITYFDIYLDEHYMNSTDNNAYFWYNSSTSHSDLPVCINKDDLTTDYFYRNDFDQILVCASILFIALVFVPLKIVSRMFGRWLKW